MEEQNQQHSHWIQCKKGTLEYFGPESNGVFRKIRHANIEKSIFVNSKINDPDRLKGKEVWVKNIQVDKASFENIAGTNFPNLSDNGIIAFLPLDNVNIDNSGRYKLTLFKHGRWGCSNPGSELDSNNKLPGVSAKFEDKEHVIISTKGIWHNKEGEPSEDCSGILQQGDEFTALIVVEKELYDCWNKEIDAYIKNGGERGNIQFAFNDKFDCEYGSLKVYWKNRGSQVALGFKDQESNC